MAIRSAAGSLTKLFGRCGRKDLGCALLLGSVFFANMLTAQTPQRPRILGISHIGLLAHDFEASRAFYGQFLGFEEPYNLKKPDGSLSMTFFKINDSQVIELFPESKLDTDRMTHYSLITDNIEAMRTYLASKGFKVPSQAHQGRIGNVSFDVNDPDGETIEMVQYMPDGKTTLSKGQFLSPNAISDHMTHVGLIVPPPMDTEDKFYTDVLGFKEFWRGSADGKTLSYVNLRVPESTEERKDDQSGGLRGISQREVLVEQADSRWIKERRRLLQPGHCQGSKLRSGLQRIGRHLRSFGRLAIFGDADQRSNAQGPRCG